MINGHFVTKNRHRNFQHKYFDARTIHHYNQFTLAEKDDQRRKSE